MSVRFKGHNNNTIVYSKGMTDKDIMDVLSRRIQKRQVELDRRKWIVDEYNSLLKKQNTDKQWLAEFNKGFSVVKKEPE